jgi:predicted nucleic acid-binding protein
MTNSLSGIWLLDTNILVAFFDTASSKNKIAKELLTKVEEGSFKVVISSQNVLELSAVLIAGYKGNREEVAADLEQLRDFFGESAIIYPKTESLNQYLTLLKKNYPIHMTDLFLISTMLSSNIDSIITNDLAFESVPEIKVYNPFEV